MASRDTSPSLPPTPSRRRLKTFARRCERICCTIAICFPLAFIYGLTTWAVWVDSTIGYHKSKPEEQITYQRRLPATISIVFYLLLNTCYTVAVFTDPGSPLNSNPSQKRGKYSILPTSEPTTDHNEIQSITVSSTGGARYCKKCQVPKPDRAHHCSTCKRCVLKMDHHCPWLATCLGLHNYKAFILFLVYVSLFCQASFVSSAGWVYNELFINSQNLEDFAPVNVIMLAVLSGIIGLVISFFTGWHLYLCVRGQTTIECLEKTRYLSSVRKRVEQNRQARFSQSHSRESLDLTSTLKRARDDLLEFHANAVPGASRFEEGEEHASPTPSVSHDFSSLNNPPQPHFSNPASQRLNSGQGAAVQSLRQNQHDSNYSSYADLEARREVDRYEDYLSEQESSSLPNAFDLGWRKNLTHLFGPNPWLWALPVCNTTGDGWRWEVSQRWIEAHREVVKKKEERLANAQQVQHVRQDQPRYPTHLGSGYHDYDQGQRPHDVHHDDDHRTLLPKSAMSMHTLQRQKSRQDFDHGEDGEVGSFQVSGSESGDGNGDYPSDSDSGSDSGRGITDRGAGGRPPLLPSSRRQQRQQRQDGSVSASKDDSWHRDW